MYICEICKKQIKSSCALSKHIHSIHTLLPQQYYDMFYKKDNEGICPTCGKNTPFLKISKGYQKHCSSKCAQNDLQVNNIFRNNNPQKNSAIREKTKQTCQIKYGGNSALCNKIVKEKGIRLIHIYEFEDFTTQIELLKSLILGVDKYPKTDFNKNNFLLNIPEPIIIYDDGRLVVYGAGELK